jgi:hypothetical protein
LLRLHILPTFRPLDLDEITPRRVRAWRTVRLGTTGAETTIAKAYRLLKAVLQTAADDELIRRNPCRIQGAGKESAEERPVAAVEQAELRRPDVVLPDDDEPLKRRREVEREPVLLRTTVPRRS